MTVAAWVDDVPVPASEVDADLARLRAGPSAAVLPREGTPDARQLRRWVTQRVVLRVLLDRECAARGLTPAPDPTPADPSLLGTAAADVLAVSPTARAVFHDVVRAVTVPEHDLRATYDRLRPARPERWLVRQSFDRTTPPATLPDHATPVDPATLLPEVRAAATADPAPIRSTLGWHLIAVNDRLPAGPIPYEEVRDRLAAELTVRARQTAFARWLDAETATRVRLAPGHEHPADPANPDATHRH